MNVARQTAASSETFPPGGGRIDVHHHFMFPEYVAHWGDRLGSISAAGSVAPWSAELSLELMAFASVETAITSISSPGWPVAAPATVAGMCRTANETAARLMRDYPGRFGMFGNVPMPHVDETLAEIAFCLDTLGADGIALFTNYGGRYLGDPVFEPVMAELSRRNAVVFVHPVTPPGGRSLPDLSESTLDYPFETTRTITSILYNGTAARFPGIRFIFSHAGGAVPYLAGRIATLSELHPDFRQRGFDDVQAALAGFWYDITQSANPATFRALRAIVPLEKLLFGTDVPFARKRQIDLTVRDLPELTTADELVAIGRTNALPLFPRLRQPSDPA